MPVEVAAILPPDLPRGRGLDALSPAVRPAVSAIRTVTSCESLGSSLAEHPVTAREMLEDDDTIDPELQRLMSELQLSVSQAAAACTGGDTAGGEKLIALAARIATSVEARDAELVG